VPEIANLLRLIFTSIGKLAKRFSQESIQEFGFLKLYELGTEIEYTNYLRKLIIDILAPLVPKSNPP